MDSVIDITIPAIIYLKLMAGPSLPTIPKKKKEKKEKEKEKKSLEIEEINPIYTWSSVFSKSTPFFLIMLLPSSKPFNNFLCLWNKFKLFSLTFEILQD